MDLTTIEQTAQVSAELANDYLIGELTQAAGLPGGPELKDSVVNLMGDLGIEVTHASFYTPPHNGLAEAGWVAAAFAATRAALAGTAKSAAAAIVRNPKSWASAVAIAGGGIAVSAGAYEWMTADQNIQMEAIRVDAALKAAALEAVPESERAEIAMRIAQSKLSLPSTTILPWVIGGAIAGAAFLWWKSSKV